MNDEIWSFCKPDHKIPNLSLTENDGEMSLYLEFPSVIDVRVAEAQIDKNSKVKEKICLNMFLILLKTNSTAK